MTEYLASLYEWSKSVAADVAMAYDVLLIKRPALLQGVSTNNSLYEAVTFSSHHNGVREKSDEALIATIAQCATMPEGKAKKWIDLISPVFNAPYPEYILREIFKHVGYLPEDMTTRASFKKVPFPSLVLAQEKIKDIVSEKKSYCTTLLIDDYRSKNYLLDKKVRDIRHRDIMNQFHILAKEYNLSIDFFAFESMMIRVAKKIVKRMPKNLLVKDFYKQKQSYVTMLRNQGFRVGLVELWEDETKYSCALLSAAWMLCRLGEESVPSDRLVSVRGKMFASKNIITILPKEYETTENKAKVILLSAGYGHLLDKIESIYY